VRQDPLEINTCATGGVTSPRRLTRISGSYSNLASPRVSTQLNWYRGNSIAPGVGRANLQQVPHPRRCPSHAAAQSTLCSCCACALSPLFHLRHQISFRLASQAATCVAHTLRCQASARARAPSKPPERGGAGAPSEPPERGGARAQMAADAVAVADRQAQAAESGLDASGRPVVTKVEDFGRKLAHQFPWAPAAYVAVGLALRRRFLSDPEAPSTLARRRQITKARRGRLSRDMKGVCSDVEGRGTASCSQRCSYRAARGLKRARHPGALRVGGHAQAA